MVRTRERGLTQTCSNALAKFFLNKLFLAKFFQAKSFSDI